MKWGNVLKWECDKCAKGQDNNLHNGKSNFGRNKEREGATRERGHKRKGA